MAPMIALIAASLIAWIFVPAQEAVRIGLAAMFFLTASAHFTAMRRDLAAMIPPPLTGSMWLIYATGVFEIAGAIGLLIPATRFASAICLILMLIALFPANVYAALKGVTLRGKPPTPLVPRTAMQILWIALLWWSAIA
jgi:uncharacterized membrane protein